MSARTRVLAVVALAAVAAAAATVGATMLQTRGETTRTAVTKPRAGAPPLLLDFGVRADAEARALDGAQRLYNKRGQKGRSEAAAVFARYRSLEAQIGAAFARWPDGTLDELKRLVAAHPRSALAELHLGWAFYWAGRTGDAIASWKRAVDVQPDSPPAVDADTALHPSLAPGLPYMVTAIHPAPALGRLPAAQELAALARAAARPDANAKILYGVALWNLRRPVSARRELAGAARLAPGDPLARTLAAVSLFSKERPVQAFSTLGPLTRTFPKASVVRLHLGLLLLWTRRLDEARRQLRLASAAEPGSVYAQQAKTLLSALGTK